MMTGLLEKLLRRRKAEHQEAVKTFAEVVIELANGRESGLDEDALEIILEAAGKTLDDLQAEVATEQTRIELRERVRRAREARVESQVLGAQAGEHLRQFEAAKRAYESAVAPITARQAVLADLIGQEVSCLQELRGLLPADVQQAATELREQAAELRRRAATWQDRIHHREAAAWTLEQKAARDSAFGWQHGVSTKADLDAAAEHRAAAEELRAEQAELEQQAQELAEQAGKLIADALGV